MRINTRAARARGGPAPRTDGSETVLRLLERPTGRRRFLQVAGLSVVGVAAGCGDGGGGGEAQRGTTAAETGAETGAAGDVVTIDFGGEPDIGVVNYAYALEQLEAAFYTQVTDEMYSGASEEETTVLADLRAHEVAHREFFKAKLGDNAIAALTPDFSMVDFSDRSSVLETAQTFEDLGVWAYNGAAQFINAGGPLGVMPLAVAGEIVSVEARHASVIRSLLAGPDSGGAFAPAAFDMALVPSEVLPKVQPFLKTKIAVANLPSGA